MADPFSDYATVIRHLERNLLVADLKEILRECNVALDGAPSRNALMLDRWS